MVNNLKVFNNDDFGTVRTLVLDGATWFVGKDVATGLGYSNPPKAIRDHIDEEDKTVNESFMVNGTHGVLINESGMYSLVLGSKLPNAKQFKRWVTSEVLPTIRQTGSYNAPAFNLPSTYIEALECLVVAEKEKIELVKQLDVEKAKTEFFEDFVNTDSVVGMGDAAKLIGIKGVGRNNLFKILKERRILQQNAIPYQRFIDSGIFEIKEFVYAYDRFGKAKINVTTYVTQKGLEYIKKVVVKHMGGTSNEV